MFCFSRFQNVMEFLTSFLFIRKIKMGNNLKVAPPAVVTNEELSSSPSSSSVLLDVQAKHTTVIPKEVTTFTWDIPDFPTFFQVSTETRRTCSDSKTPQYLKLAFTAGETIDMKSTWKMYIRDDSTDDCRQFSVQLGLRK